MLKKILSSRFISLHVLVVKVFHLSVFVYLFVYAGAHGVLLQSLLSVFLLLKRCSTWPVRTSSSQCLWLLTEPSIFWMSVCFPLKKMLSRLAFVFCAPVLESVIASRSLRFLQWRDQCLGVRCDCGVEGQMSLFLGFLNRCYREPRVSVCRDMGTLSR